MRLHTLWLVRNVPPDDLISVSEAAELIDADPKTIYNRINDGRLRAWASGIRGKKVSRADVLRLGRYRPERQQGGGAKESEAG